MGCGCGFAGFWGDDGSFREGLIGLYMLISAIEGTGVIESWVEDGGWPQWADWDCLHHVDSGGLGG